MTDLEELGLSPRWVSAAERLPERAVSVLVWHAWNGASVGHYTDERGWFTETLDRHGYFRCGVDLQSVDPITHWMPLPSPPEGE